MAFEQRVIRIDLATHKRMTVVKKAMEAEKNRQVTYAEAVEYLVTYWENAPRLAAQEAGR